MTSRPSEDLMAVYDAHQGTNANSLWRVMGREGLESGETPLVTQFAYQARCDLTTARARLNSFRILDRAAYPKHTVVPT